MVRELGSRESGWDTTGRLCGGGKYRLDQVKGMMKKKASNPVNPPRNDTPEAIKDGNYPVVKQ